MASFCSRVKVIFGFVVKINRNRNVLLIFSGTYLSELSQTGRFVDWNILAATSCYFCILRSPQMMRILYLIQMMADWNNTGNSRRKIVGKECVLMWESGYVKITCGTFFSQVTFWESCGQYVAPLSAKFTPFALKILAATKDCFASTHCTLNPEPQLPKVGA